jgi:hypothetical protein
MIIGSVFVFGQGTAGRLSGTVTDAAGKALPGATVTAKDNLTGKEATVTANEEGNFSFAQLDFGTYTVTTTASGFKTYIANDVKIDVGRDYNLDPKLEVGSVSENVTVTAGADVVTSGTAQVSNTVSPQQILSLPLLTRNPLSLTGLQAGVSANSAQLTTINGMRTTFTNITRDGINIQDTFIRANATDFAPGRPSVDDTAEFTITTTNQEADQGYGGAQIRLVTPRGTKDFHGALFAYNRNSHFAANTFFNNRGGQIKPFRNRNQYGGKLSGPLWVPGFGEGSPVLFKDKGFFFFAYEGIRDPVTAVANRTVFTPTALTGAFRYQRTNATDVTPFCPSQTIGSVCTIPNVLTFAQSRFPAASLNGSIPGQIAAYLATFPANGNVSGLNGDSVNLGGVITPLNTLAYRFNRGSDQTRNQYSGRVDVDIDENNSLLWIYNYNKEVNLRPDVDTAGFDVTPDVVQFSANTQYTMAYRRVFSSNFVNDARGGVFTSVVPFDRVTTPDSIFALPLVTAPLAFLDQGRNTKAYNLQDNADWIMGSHNLRFGGQMQFFKVNAFNDASILPQLNFGMGTLSTFTTTNATGIGGLSTSAVGTLNGLAAFLGGAYTSVQQFFNVANLQEGFKPGATAFTPFRYENHALYLADRWTVNNQLTLSLGVRYELFPALRLNNGVALEPVFTDNANITPDLLNPAGIYNPIGGNAGRRNAYYQTDYDNFAPNIGVAWAPSFDEGFMGFLFGQNKTIIRGGYSHIYGNDSIVTSINNAAVGNAGLARTGLITSAGNFRLGQGAVPVIAPPALSTFPRTYLQNNGPGLGNFFGTVFAIDPKLQTPMVKQYSVGFQREFFGNMALEIRYVGSRSNNLGRGVDLGQIDIINNGFLNDFRKAQANFKLTGDPFCAVAGCVPLTIFVNGPGSAGHLGVAPTTASTPNLTIPRNTFTGALQNGIPADLAISFINSTTAGALNANNQPCLGSSGVFVCNPNAVPFLKFLPNAGTGVIDLFKNDGKYVYDSLQIEVRRRFSDGLYFQANYTYAKNLTNAIGTSQQLFEPYLDNAHQELDWQRADYDQTHTFNFNAIYQLPFGKGKMFLNNGGIIDKVFGGWEVSGLGQWTSGAPITFVDPRGTYNRVGRATRQTPLSTLDNNQIQALAGVFEANGNIYWINPSIINPSTGRASAPYDLLAQSTFAGQVFFPNQPGGFGGIGRSLIDGPGYFNVNMALLKNIRFTETMRLQLRAEAFNVFNNVNFSISAAQQLASITSTTFGQINSTFGSREMQFAARFEF